MSKIIAVNAGSSSLKFQLFLMPEEEVIVAGLVERIGFQDSVITIKWDGQKKSETLPIADHNLAIEKLLHLLVAEGFLNSLDELSGVGHRIVHGGDKFAASTVITQEVEDTIRSLFDLAPLHNPANLMGVVAFRKALPHVTNVAVFDTAFHQTMAPEQFLYPLPYEFYEKFQVRRYGFHGTSHLYVSQRAQVLLGNPAHSKIITVHMGNGGSIAAVKDGKSIHTTMGFTPLAGVVMGTRSGDVDPSIVTYLMSKLGLSAEQVIDIFNKKSGLLGVSGISADSRDIVKAVKEGNTRAALARQMQVNSVVDWIGSYFVMLGGCDAIIFTAGIGENDIEFRADVINHVSEALKIKIDLVANNVRGEERVITTADSAFKAIVIPTNEEIMIARDTYRFL